MTPAEERAAVLGSLEVIRQFLNGSSLKDSDTPFYYNVKDLCCSVINNTPLEAVTDLAAKLQLLVNWVDSQGLLPEHEFTFPDGETWEVQP